MVIKITERSLYPKIIELFKRISSRYGIRIEGAQEVTLPGRMFPDILAEIDGHRVLIQIKIDSIEKLIEDIAKSYPSAKSIGADLIGILFPPEVRRIRMEELEKMKEEYFLQVHVDKKHEEEILKGIEAIVEAKPIKEELIAVTQSLDYLRLSPFDWKDQDGKEYGAFMV